LYILHLVINVSILTYRYNEVSTVPSYPSEKIIIS